MAGNKKDKILRMSRVRPKNDEQYDSIAYSKFHNGSRRAFDVLMEAQGYWSNMDRFRRERERNKNYTFGKQWSDIVCVDGKQMTEEDYIKEQGNIPLVNNHIHRLVKQVLGVYRSQSKEPTCVARDREEQKLGETMSTVLQYNMQLNQNSEMNARTMEEYLISGFAVQRKWYGWQNNMLDCWTDYVNPKNFFIDSNMRDFRGWDVSMVGEVHDISIDALCAFFAESADDVRKFREIYSFAHNRGILRTYGEQFGYSRLENIDFLFASDPTLCRVIEVWRKEIKPRYRCHDYNNGDVYKIEIEDYDEMVEAVNNDRIQRGLAQGMAKAEIPLIKATWFMDNYWYFYYLSPFGDILKEGETPYEHKSHPYVFKAYPFIDGEIHSFVADVIDQQRYTNRLIMMYDWIMKSSAKGVLMFPEGSEPDGMSMEDIADEWSRANGVVFFKPKAGVPMPQQLAQNCTNIGIVELLNLQLKFFEEISGVNGALQGKPGYAGTSAAKYNQETQNATLALLDILDSYSSFVRDGAYKDVKNIQQFYDTKRVFNIAGKTGVQIVYDPKKIRDVMFDLSIIESTATPAYRQMANDILMQLWKAQAISTEQLLQHGDFPFGDDLLQSLQSQKEQLEQGQAPGNLPQELLERAQEGANMGAVNMAYNAIMGRGRAAA
ncbi:hypothetical protein [uncultured Bacteroides sp.]|uniref:portal protein n=1 Tax=uncultured Bacteroides sp. TaxID=162156 RepID=UPI00261646B9|nr:hypothetical protein [uncultured Bacteroides sp.]